MITELESLVSSFESGALNRREFMQGLFVVTATSGTSTKPKANSLNHVSLAVSDVDGSQEFYERVLGVTEVSRQSNGVNLGLGDSFLGLYDIEPAGQIHHLCVGVDDFEIEGAARDLRQLGIDPYIRQDRPELYFTDPDGIIVQLSAREYRG